MSYLSDIKSTRERALSDASLIDVEEIKFDTDDIKNNSVFAIEIPLYNTPLESPLIFLSSRILNNYIHYRKKGSE